MPVERGTDEAAAVLAALPARATPHGGGTISAPISRRIACSCLSAQGRRGVLQPRAVSTPRAPRTAATDIHRMVNLLQVSSAFGRAMESVDRMARCASALFPSPCAPPGTRRAGPGPELRHCEARARRRRQRAIPSRRTWTGIHAERRAWRRKTQKALLTRGGPREGVDAAAVAAALEAQADKRCAVTRQKAVPEGALALIAAPICDPSR